MPGIHDDDADDLSIAATRAVTRLTGGLSSSSTPSSIPFAPGAIIAGRYRLASLLGRGGMGEVYRADDLTLDQTVALKFLPAGIADNGERLAQFHAELRIARQVSHKNVCRLYDLGEHEGRRFLTMEYVDGEDLATLLRRIGRLPQDKAVDIARQLCAGIAAAHERGVLHRDLKPANVMIDGEGNVRITDFGLAVAAGDVTASRAGTPQYMAPEQLNGGAATVRSDIYALGLVLFEMFTGRRAFEAKTFNELLTLHETRTLATPSSMVRDLDPTIERVIMRCLEHDPELRPGSALLVAAALPGGDPLAAALAAGETPSPEMVAAAGEHSAFSLRIGLSLMTFIIVGLLTAAILSDRVLLIALIPLDKSVDTLEDRARDVTSKLGYADRPADTARGFLILGDYFFYVLRTDKSATRWNSLSTGAFPSLRFWYRTSPTELDWVSSNWRPSLGDPPQTTSGMTSLVVDTQGRLTQFTAVPPQVNDTQATDGPTDWNLLFEAAGLDPRAFHEVPQQWVPNTYADVRKAWVGPLPGKPEIELRVEAAAYRGRPSFFQVVGPWTRRPRMIDPEQQGRTGAMILRSGVFVIVLGLSIAALALARYNIRSGRGDRRGATRLALFVFGTMTAAWLIGARHSFDALNEFGRLLQDLIGPQLTVAAILWLIYVALEPYVRRYCPEILVSWTRVLSGRFRDPRVGRDTLVGVAAGIGVAFMRLGLVLLPKAFGYAPPPPRVPNTAFLLSTRQALSALLTMPQNALTNALLITLAFVAVRLAVKRTWLAATISGVALAFVVVAEAGTEQIGLNIIYAIAVSAVYLLVLVFFGVFPTALAFLVNFIIGQGGLTLDFSKLYATTSVWLLVLVAGLAAFGFYASRTGEPPFGKLSAT
jgi:serine/threonine protein kinase